MFIFEKNSNDTTSELKLENWWFGDFLHRTENEEVNAKELIKKINDGNLNENFLADILAACLVKTLHNRKKDFHEMLIRLWEDVIKDCYNYTSGFLKKNKNPIVAIFGCPNEDILERRVFAAVENFFDSKKNMYAWVTKLTIITLGISSPGKNTRGKDNEQQKMKSKLQEILNKNKTLGNNFSALYNTDEIKIICDDKSQDTKENIKNLNEKLGEVKNLEKVVFIWLVHLSIFLELQALKIIINKLILKSVKIFFYWEVKMRILNS